MTLIIAVISAGAVILAALIGFFGVWMKSLLDMQRSDRDHLKTEVDGLKRRVGNLETQGRYKDDYINTLRSHIEEEKPPPPPSYPPALLRIAMEGI